jgi:signal transduction histidine kinase
MDTLRRTLGDRVILSTSLAVDLWRVRIDPRAIEAAILNLASSAREVMRERGRLLIETRNFSGAAHGCDFPPGNYVRISVSSMGARTPASSATDLTKMQLVFKRLGGSIATEFDLRTVDQIVTGLGGHVTIDSGVGPDTTTHFHFPRVDNPSSEAFDTRSRD